MSQPERRVFSHSGMVGDIIYALVAMRAMGGGTLRVYSRRESTSMNVELVDSLAALLCTQPYIDDCQYDAEPGDVDLDRWTQYYTDGLTIADMALWACGQSTALRNRSWLEVSEPLQAAPVVFHRSPRYRNPRFPWNRVRDKYGRMAVLVGSPEEHRAFCEEVGPIDYLPTANYLDLARVIAGADLFVGNQSSPYAIAEALKKNSIQEVCLQLPNCIFERTGALYGVDESIILPDLE